MALEKYNSKRDFTKTAEPEGIKKSSKGALKFVVQKHAASRLHYDFRLEIDGVLVSWAVPKGPSADPSVKRLAMQTEDHPMNYLDFEGIIPKGEYGGGTVMVWDMGTYRAEGNETISKDNLLMRKQLASGSIKIILSGTKLKGAWHLVKMKTEGDAWLLMKHKDAFSSTTTEFDGLSVLSNRNLDQIAEAKEIWKSNKTKVETKEETSAKTEVAATFTKKMLAEATRLAHFPEWKPMLATLADEPFDNENWIFETKYDGYRSLVEINDGQVKLVSRNGNEFTKYAALNKEFSISDNVILDGEIVIEDKTGKSKFQWLQHFQDNPNKGILKFYAFDIVYYNGFDLRQVQLITRKKILKTILPKSDKVVYSEHIVTDGIKAFKAAEKAGGEGIIAKKADSVYLTSKRSKQWLKIKTEKQQEMVIGGFTEPQGSRNGLGALLCGYYDDGKLKFVGKVGSGFTESILNDLRERLDKIKRKTSPFVDPPNEPNVHWVTPKLVAQVKFSEMTDTNKMRHPVYLGLRTDKSASDVKLETPEISTYEIDDKKKSSLKTKPSTTKNKSNRVQVLTKKASKQLSDKVEFTNPDKIFWPKEKITKGDVITYYNSIADIILPYLIDRPQSLRRTPSGIKDAGFFQKNVAGLVPKWVKTRKIKSDSKDESIEYLLCQDKDTLLYLINLGCIELNPWSSRVGSLNNPDYIIFDLDPKDAPMKDIIATAQKVKEVLDKLKVPRFIKTSGGNGLHVFIPVKNKYTYEQTRTFSHLVSQMVHRELPEITSLERMPAKRKGKVYLDYLQNGKGKTMASIYSLRPREGAGVSMPLEWDEVNDTLNLQDYNFFTALDRLQEKGDLWQHIFDHAIDLKDVLANLSL